MVSFTVVPLHNLDLPAGSRIPFGTKFILQDVPEWLRQDKHILNDINTWGKTSAIRGSVTRVKVPDVGSRCPRHRSSSHRK